MLKWQKVLPNGRLITSKVPFNSNILRSGGGGVGEAQINCNELRATLQEVPKGGCQGKAEAKEYSLIPGA